MERLDIKNDVGEIEMVINELLASCGSEPSSSSPSLGSNSDNPEKSSYDIAINDHTIISCVNHNEMVQNTSEGLSSASNETSRKVENEDAKDTRETFDDHVKFCNDGDKSKHGLVENHTKELSDCNNDFLKYDPADNSITDAEVEVFPIIDISLGSGCGIASVIPISSNEITEFDEHSEKISYNVVDKIQPDDKSEQEILNSDANRPMSNSENAESLNVGLAPHSLKDSKVAPSNAISLNILEDNIEELDFFEEQNVGISLCDNNTEQVMDVDEKPSDDTSKQDILNSIGNVSNSTNSANLNMDFGSHTINKEVISSSIIGMNSSKGLMVLDEKTGRFVSFSEQSDGICLDDNTRQSLDVDGKLLYDIREKDIGSAVDMANSDLSESLSECTDVNSTEEILLKPKYSSTSLQKLVTSNEFTKSINEIMESPFPKLQLVKVDVTHKNIIKNFGNLNSSSVRKKMRKLAKKSSFKAKKKLRRQRYLSEFPKIKSEIQAEDNFLASCSIPDLFIKNNSTLQGYRADQHKIKDKCTCDFCTAYESEKEEETNYSAGINVANQAAISKNLGKVSENGLPQIRFESSVSISSSAWSDLKEPTNDYNKSTVNLISQNVEIKQEVLDNDELGMFQHEDAFAEENTLMGNVENENSGILASLLQQKQLGYDAFQHTHKKISLSTSSNNNSQVTGLRFKCPDCNKVFDTEKRLKLHKYKHRRTKPYRCPHCEKIFILEQNYKMHLKLKHKEKNSLADENQTESTDVELQNKRNVNEFIRIKKGSKCKICYKVFSMTSNCLRHIRDVHYNKQGYIKAAQDKLSCIKAAQDKPSCIKATLDKPSCIKTAPRKNECKICSRYFPSPSHLRKHIGTTTHKFIESQNVNLNEVLDENVQQVKKELLVDYSQKKKQFKCLECGKCFRNVTYLIRHKAIHAKTPGSTSVYNRLCTTCGKIFVDKYTLKRHKETHMKNKCTYCVRKFESVELLNLHLKEHLKKENQEAPVKTVRMRKSPLRIKDNQFECKRCGGKFKSRIDLEEHLMTHKSFCELCGKAYIWPNDLKRHKKLAHKL